MQLETYISDLLYRYECVVIPDFGAFLTQPVSAKIDEQNHTFYPPKKVLSFNEQLKNNDGLLAKYIADVEKTPYENAVKKIAKKTKSLKSYLAQGETLSFKNIGDIVLNHEGKIVFEPSYHLNYLTDAFGLTQFVSPLVAREVYKEEVEEINTSIGSATKVVPITTEKRKNRPFYKYAAVAILALSIGGFGASKYYVNQIETHNQLAQEEAEQQIENRIQEATFIIDNPLPTVSLNIDKQSGNFHIVAGAFRIEENCDKQLKILQSKGFNARKIGANKYGLHQVVYGSYETRSEAQRELYTIRNSHNKDAWLLVQKLN